MRCLAAPVLAQLARPFDALANDRPGDHHDLGRALGRRHARQRRYGVSEGHRHQGVQDRSASPVERITKLKVSLHNQTVDLFQLADGLVPLAVKQGVAEKLNRASPRMPQRAQHDPGVLERLLVPQIFSITGSSTTPSW